MSNAEFLTFRNVVAGALRPGETVSHGIDPSTRKPLWDIPVATAKDLDDAVAAGRAAFPGWSQTPWKQRQAYIRQARAVLHANGPAMAKLISAEGGKPPQFAELEVEHALRSLDFYAGVLQALNGGPELGPMICDHPGIQKISFTGSTATGKKIMASASSKLKDITLELGGNSASIICPDVDVDIAAPQVALGSFFNSGQLCVASKRIYVHEDIYEAFLKKLVDTVGSWKVGPPSAEGVMLGPVQNEMQYNIVKSIFEDTARNGYKFALGGLQKSPDDSNFLISPAIVDCPPDSSVVVRQEAFGPIVPVLKWSNEAELMPRVNDTSSGLGGAVWSKDLVRAHRIASQIEAGTVWINSFEKPVPQAYLAGHKESGVGGEGGKQGLFAFLKPQMIHLYKSPVVSSKL
ncbi:hypothetical protein ACHAQA_002956 [Verticillium albo-atrum]